MKTKAEVIEVEDEGLVSLLNKQVLIMCFNYFYTGKLVGVNEQFIKLEDCYIVYETGPWKDKNYKDAQKVGDEHFIQMSSIESYCQHSKLIIL